MVVQLAYGLYSVPVASGDGETLIVSKRVRGTDDAVDNDLLRGSANPKWERDDPPEEIESRGAIPHEGEEDDDEGKKSPLAVWKMKNLVDVH